MVPVAIVAVIIKAEAEREQRYRSVVTRRRCVVRAIRRLRVIGRGYVNDDEELTLDYDPDYLNYFIPACKCPVCNGKPPRSAKGSKPTAKRKRL